MPVVLLRILLVLACLGWAAPARAQLPVGTLLNGCQWTGSSWRCPAGVERQTSGAAPTGAPFVTLGTNPVLTDEHVLGSTAEVVVSSGPGAVSLSLGTTGVTPGSYGDGTHVGQFTVDSKGRLTAAASVAIVGAPPSGAASGDLGGTFPGPDVLKVHGVSYPASPSTSAIPQVSGANTVTYTLTPSGLTSLSAATLTGTSLVTGPIRDKGGQVYHVKAAPFSLVGGCNTATGLPDDRAALVAGLAAMSISGATLFFPADTYCFGSGITINQAGLRLMGETVDRATNQTILPRLVYTGATGSLFTFNASARGVEIANLKLLYTHPTYSGDLLRVDGAHWLQFRDLSMAADSGTSGLAASLIHLEDVIDVMIERVSFSGGAIAAVEGASLAGARCSHAQCFANTIRVRDSHFDTGSGLPWGGPPILVGGEGWTITGNTFEPYTGTTAGAIGTTDLGAGGLVVTGNWIGDADTGTWVEATAGSIEGAHIGGNLVHAGTGTAILYDLRSTSGVSLTGDFLNTDSTSATVLVDSTTLNLLSLANHVNSGLAISGTPAGRSVFDDGSALNVTTANGLFQIAANGQIVAKRVTTGSDLNFYLISPAGTNHLRYGTTGGSSSTFALTDDTAGVDRLTMTSGGDMKFSGSDFYFKSGGVPGILRWSPTSTTKTIVLPNGSTDFTATGATGAVLRQSSAGAAITVSVLSLASSDFANQGTTTTVLHGNASGNPSFGAVVSADLNITTTTCTAQFVRSISSGAVGTCATVANADLANSSVTIGSTSVSLGGTAATISGLTLVAPVLGAATATSINGLTITSSTGTLTIANGKVLTASNTLTFTGTDSSSVAFGAGGTVVYTGRSISTTSPITGGGDLSADRTIACATCGVTGTGLSQFASTTSAQFFGVISDETGGTGVVVGSISPSLTTPTIAGGSITALTTFALRDTSAAFDVTLAAVSSTTLTAGRTLTLDVTNAARTIKLTGSPTLADWFDQDVKTTGTPQHARLGVGVAADGTIPLLATGTSNSNTSPIFKATNNGTGNDLFELDQAHATTGNAGVSFKIAGTQKATVQFIRSSSAFAFLNTAYSTNDFQLWFNSDGSLQFKDPASSSAVRWTAPAAGGFNIGATTASMVTGELGFTKITASGSAPGAGTCKEEVVTGSTGTTCKKILYCGTSTTPTTIIDNVGTGC